MTQATPTETGAFRVHSQAHGPHWIAWVTSSDREAPERSVVLVGRTQEEAEARARQWIEREEGVGSLSRWSSERKRLPTPFRSVGGRCR